MPISNLAKRCVEYSDKILSFPQGTEEKFNYALKWADEMMKDFPGQFSNWNWVIQWALDGLGEMERQQSEVNELPR